MKNIIDFILESRGQRISQRASNRPYDPNKDDKLLQKKASRPKRAQKLRETKLDKQVQELCSELVNDFIIKFYKLNANNIKLIRFNDNIDNILTDLDRKNNLEDITPDLDWRYGGIVCLNYYKNDGYYDIRKKVVLQYNSADSFSNILNNFNLKYLSFKWDGWKESDNKESSGLTLYYDSKFLSSVLHKLRKHDLAKKAEKDEKIDLLDLFNDLPDKYNKDYFADKFKEFESAYNDVLEKW